MMKHIILIGLLFFSALRVLGQEGELVTEERSSAWLRISPPLTVQKKAINVRKKPATASRSTRKIIPAQKKPTPSVVPKPEDEFNKTNNKVNRFQKGKKD